MRNTTRVQFYGRTTHVQSGVVQCAGRRTLALRQSVQHLISESDPIPLASKPYVLHQGYCRLFLIYGYELIMPLYRKQLPLVLAQAVRYVGTTC